MCGLPPTSHTHKTHKGQNQKLRVLPQEGALGHHSGLCDPPAFLQVHEEARGERGRGIREEESPMSSGREVGEEFHTGWSAFFPPILS